MKHLFISLKAFFIFAGCIWLLTNTAPADIPGTESSSKITHVVVYPNHAQVTRELWIDADKGENTIRFTGLVPILNPGNLRATASEGVRITGTETRTVFLKESHTDEIKELDAKIQALSDKIAALMNASARWDEEKAFYAALKERVSREVGKELAKNKISVSDWEKMLAFVREGLLTGDEKTAAIEIEVRDLERDLGLFEKKRQAYLQRHPKEMREVTVSFTAADSGRKAIRIHYIVPSAGWTPVYDIHLDRQSGQVLVVGHGQVTQRTGESWKDVLLTLAMSRPDFELALPVIKPLVVSFSAEEMRQIAVFVNDLNEQPQASAREWSMQRFKGQQEAENFKRNLEQLSQVQEDQLVQYGLNRKIIREALSRLVDRFAGVRYDLKKTETIPCDASPHKVVVFASQVPVDLKYVATPVLGNTVVLKGEIRNTTGYPILEGQISVFIDNSYVGASKVKSAAQNEGMSFCFGPDDALVVKRELKKRTVKGPENFRQSQVITYDYCITVENFNDRVATVEVTDQIPTSQTSEIQVEFQNSNHKEHLEKQTGILTWTLDVPPAEKEKIDFSFSIECPVGRTVYWK